MEGHFHPPRFNTIELRITDSSGKTSTVSTTVEIVVGLTWDSNGATANRTDGAGVWLTANQWWDGTANQSWTPGSSATFGNGGTGGAVTLASATSVNTLVFNSFSGTYTLGTAGNAITLNGGIIKNSVSGAVIIITGSTQATASIAFANDSSLGLDIGSTVTAAGAAVDLANGRIAVSGTPGGASHVLLTAASITGSPVLANQIPGYELVVVGNQLLLNSTGAVDLTPPTLVDITDNAGGGTVPSNTLVTYTVTFSEDMNPDTVQTASFGNAGTSSGVIGSVTETTPGVFIVSVTPTSPGTLQLKVNAGAVLNDVAGNALGTTWTSVGSTTGSTFASTCYIGLAVGSGSDTTLNTSQFSNLSVIP
jgi:hypothetical protein